MVQIDKRFVAVIAFASIGLAAACSSSKQSPSSGAGESGDDGGTSNADGSSEDPRSKCSAEKTIDTCADCCGGVASITPYEKTFTTCACEGPCKTQCAKTYCATTPQQADTACAECLDSEATFDACEPPANTACQNDAKCKAFTDCDLIANCLAKSPGDGGG